MTVSESQKILREEILPQLDGWKVCGRFAYLPRPDDILRGIYLAGSSSATVVFVEAFAMPLYVPTDTIYFNLGIRLKRSNGWERWSVDIGSPKAFARDLLHAIQHEGISWLRQFGNPDSVIKFEESLPEREAATLHHLQPLAYSHAYVGHIEAALKALTQVVARAEANASVSPWTKPIAERAKYLIQLLRKEPDAAKAQLSNWVDETRKVLKLPARGS